MDVTESENVEEALRRSRQRYEEAEEALRKSEALYHSLVETVPLSIFRKDLEGRFIFANQRFADSVGRKPAQIMGLTDFDFYPRALAEKYQRDDQEVIAAGQMFEAVEAHHDPGRLPAYVQVLKAPVRGSQGELVGIQGIYWDVTARKRAEDALRATEQKIGVAREIQQKLFPAAAPAVPGFDIAGMSVPAEATGGDYFDYLHFPDGSLGVVIGDVTGHGFGPALLMAATRAYLRTLAQTYTDVGTILTLANRVLAQDTGDDLFVTMVLGRLDPATRALEYASAGHPTGYVLDAEGQVRNLLMSTAIPLGVLPDFKYATSEAMSLEPGNLILFLTDGIAEARTLDETAFGVDRILELVRSKRGQDARRIVTDLYQAVCEFAQDTPQLDDITAVVLKVVN